MNQKLKPLTRIFTLISAIALVAVLFFPLWRIELAAPQYPEGLNLVIYPHKLGGDVEVVNGLNHYIGMRTLHDKDFVEFAILPYIIGSFALFGFLTLLINRKWFYTAWTGFFVAFGIIAMVDFYRWEYNYGHNLDPTAPIRVPGMAYQPPFIGYKQLLNFGAYSIPDIGGWLFIAVGVMLLAGLFIELRRTVTITKKLEIKTVTMTAMMTIILTSCHTDPEPLVIGTDACSFCKMTITQPNYGAEWITSKGRVYKFDDTHCLIGYLKVKLKDETGEVWLVDFNNPKNFIAADKAILLQSDNFRSPMGGNTAAFQSDEILQTYMEKFPGKVMHWNEIAP